MSAAVASVGSDWVGRELTAAEQEARRSLLPALEVWTRYLARMGWFPTLPQAVGHGGAVELRERGAWARDLVGGVRLAVHPPFALLYAQQVLGQGRGGPSLSALVEALEFMGGEELTRFSPVGEAPPSYPRMRAAAGWWHLSREAQRRVHQARYVPVLTPRSGPRPSGAARVAAGRSLRVVADPGLTVGLLRDYAAPHRATALLAVAVTEHRPLCSRRRGRSPSGGWSAASVVTDSVLVGLGGLAVYAGENRDRLGLVDSSAAAVRAAVESVVVAQPHLLVAVSGFAALDSGGTVRRARDWWRMRLADVAHGSVEEGALAGEVAAWRLGRSMVEVAGVVDGRRRDEAAAGAVRMPRGVRPEDVFPDLDGAYVFEADRAVMVRSERAARGLLYPDE